MDDEQITRAEALEAAANTALGVAEHLATSGGFGKPGSEATEGSILGAVRKAWSGSASTPGQVSEYRRNTFEDYVLRAAHWIVTGEDLEQDSEEEDL